MCRRRSTRGPSSVRRKPLRRRLAASRVRTGQTLTFEEFQSLSGPERNQLFRTDQAKYAELSGRSAS